MMLICFSGPIWHWRGPAPHYFVTVPERESQDIKALSRRVTYGWGMIPVSAQLGESVWKTSLFEKDQRYIVPIKMAIRKAERLSEGDVVSLRLEV